MNSGTGTVRTGDRAPSSEAPVKFEGTQTSSIMAASRSHALGARGNSNAQ